jgi:hypothetical protein
VNFRKDFLLVEPHESLLVQADLVDVYVVVAGLDVLLDGVDVSLRVGPADHGLGHIVLADHLGGLLEVPG